jgi:parallel beta-helix repeat protein
MDGIFAYGEKNCTIQGNTILNNTKSGIAVQGGSMYMTVTDNVIEDNGWFGIGFYVSNLSLVEGNYFRRNGLTGPSDWNNPSIGLSNACNNITIRNNNIIDSKYGIAVWDSNFTKIYHNNIINNIHQFSINNAQDISWDNGYPSGGNYWSDYLGTDDFWGLNQTLKGSDLIGDFAYVIDGSNKDRYPLTMQWHLTKPPVNEFPDLNGDGAVNIIDISLVAKHFGEKFNP